MKRMRGWLLSASVATAVAAAATMSPGAARAESKETVNLGAAISPEMLLPIFVAQHKGCYAQQGIDFHLRPLGGPQTRDALASGQINFALFHVAPIWIASQKGLPFKFISMFYTKEIFGMVAAESLRTKVKGVHDLKELQGMTAVPGSASYAASMFYLGRYGLNASKDLKMTYVASTDPKIWLNAIETEKVQFLGGVWEPVFTTAIQKKVAFPIFDPADPKQHTEMFGGDVSTLGLVTTDDIIKSKPDLAKRMIACVNAGLADLPKESDDGLVDIMLADGTVKLDRTDLKGMIHRIRGNYEPDGRPSKSKYERGVAAYVKAGYLKAPVPYEAVVDPRFTGTAN